MRRSRRLWGVINATEEETKELKPKDKTLSHFSFFWHVSSVACSLTPCLFGLSVYQSVDTVDAHSVCPRHTLHLWKTASVYSGWYYTHTRMHTQRRTRTAGKHTKGKKVLSYSDNGENTPIHWSPAWRGLKRLLAFFEGSALSCVSTLTWRPFSHRLCGHVHTLLGRCC